MTDQLALSIGQYSDKGRKAINQDFHDARIPAANMLAGKGIAFALADGISSSEVSQEASKVAVTSFLSDYFSTPESWTVKTSGERVLRAVNSWLYTQSRQGEHRYDRDKGYVCTFSGMVIRSSTAHLFHIGDARIYRFRDGMLVQLTDDHRLVISSHESYLSRALGLDSKLLMDYLNVDVEEGDCFLSMTDGIYEHVSDDAMVAIVNAHADDLDHAAKTMVETAFEAGSGDNLTVQVVRVDRVPKKDVEAIHKQLGDKPFPPLLEAGESFDGFSILKVLSSSSRSHVYLAADEQSGAKVVLKCPSVDLRDDAAYLERLVMEEWVAKRISNVHVLKAYEQQHPRNYLYTAMEYVEAQTLTQWMHDNPQPTLEQVRHIGEQIAKGLQAFHRLEMVHQDIRPENILIDANGMITVIDFGSTRVEGIADVNTFLDQHHILGTAQYSAPEYFIGEVGTSCADLFSLGVIVYQMVSGRLPYGTEVIRCTTKAAQRKLKYDSLHTDEFDVPQWIDETLRKALQIDPFKRYQELSEFIYDLRHPNPEYLRKIRAPIYERSPVLFWKVTAVIEAVGIVVLLAR
jgi:serine/threonine protein phosphatase PrpC